MNLKILVNSELSATMSKLSFVAAYTNTNKTSRYQFIIYRETNKDKDLL